MNAARVSTTRIAQAVTLALSLAAGHALAQPTGDRSAHDQARDAAQVRYDTARQQCASLAGNAKDVCLAEAKLERTRAEAGAEARYKNTPKARQEAAEDIAEAQYELAKERCDDRGGNAKDVCRKEAKAAYEQALAESKAERRSAEAHRDARKQAADARRDAEEEKCENYAGDAKEACLKRARGAAR